MTKRVFGGGAMVYGRYFSILSFLVIYWTREPLDTTPRSMYGLCSLSYLGAMLSSNQALQYVSYPTQVLGKSCKPIPVMVFGALFARRHYSLRKYLFTLMIVLGVALFFYESGKDQSKQEMKEIGFGEALLVRHIFLRISKFFSRKKSSFSALFAFHGWSHRDCPGTHAISSQDTLQFDDDVDEYFLFICFTRWYG
jgi:hypothetical protein